MQILLADAVTAYDSAAMATVIIAVGTAAAAIGKMYSDYKNQRSRTDMDGKAQGHQQAKQEYEEAKLVYERLCATFESRLIAVEADRASLVKEVEKSNDSLVKLIEEHAKCREDTIRLNGKIELLESEGRLRDAKIALLEERLSKVDRHTENNVQHVKAVEQLVADELKKVKS